MSVFGWSTVDQLDDMQSGADAPFGSFALTGPVERPDPLRTPMRGDVAHIALAGRYFVPHYAVPMQRMAGDMGATLRAAPGENAEILDGLAPGERFDMLDCEGDWAWGCLGPEGPVGYIALTELEDPFA